MSLPQNAEARKRVRAQELLRQIHDGFDAISQVEPSAVLSMDWVAAVPGREVVVAAAKYVSELGFAPDGEKLLRLYDRLRFARSDAALTDWARGKPPEFQVELSQKLGPYPKPLEDDEEHGKVQHDRCLLVIARSMELAACAKDLRELLEIHTESRPGEQLDPPKPTKRPHREQATSGDPKRFGPNRDYTTFQWGDESFEFSPRQAACICVLWQAYEDKEGVIGQHYILENAREVYEEQTKLNPRKLDPRKLAGLENAQLLRDVFKFTSDGKTQTHGAWDKVIVTDRKGSGNFRLSEPSTGT